MGNRKGARRTTGAVEILDQMIGEDEELRRMVNQAVLEFEIAQMIYDARTAARLTQAQLAKLVGTTQSAISRLEDADYRGHSLPMLQRIGKALHKRLEVRFVPDVA
jgi:DNA-binding XRE family transcriptional regulator